MRTIGAVLLMLGLAAPAFSGAVQDPPQDWVSLADTADGNYLVEGEFTAKAPILLAWEVLTDYAGLTRTVASMVLSRVLEQADDSKLVEQVAKGGFFIFKKTVKVRLRVREQFLRRIDFEDEQGGVFKTYKGGWELEGAEGGVRVRYRLTANRGALASEGLERWAFKREAASLLRQLRAEVERRSEAIKGEQPALQAALAQHSGGSHE